MPTTASVKRDFKIQRSARGRVKVQPGTAPQLPPVGRLPRVTRLMALAIHFDELLRTGVVTSQAELARMGRVSRPRLTQIMNLLYLSPEIQEEILCLPKVISGRDPITEREIRIVTNTLDWQLQRQALDSLC